MITDRNKCNFVTICVWLSFLITSSVTRVEAVTVDAKEMQQQEQQQREQLQQHFAKANSKPDEETNELRKESADPKANAVHAFNPRLDYSNEWRPVGRGDPLKNDPTFDYSPPTLEHVRYWAETKDGKSDINKSMNNKSDVMLLGMPNSANLRATLPHLHAHVLQLPSFGGHAMKNPKAESPLLQPKYTSVRRSYFAQQLPTRLMPPPMQANSPASASYNMLIKSPLTEHRHNTPASHMPASTSVNKSTQSKPHYSSISTPSSWMYSSAAALQVLHHQQQHMSSPPRMPGHYDTHPHESVHYFSYTRPGNGMGASTTSSAHNTESQSLSPNSIYHSHNALKASAQRKPWLHELLQKEVVRPTKPGLIAAAHYVMNTTKPIYERIPATSLVGISTTYEPVTYVTTSTTHAPQPTMVAITSAPSYHYLTTTTTPSSSTTTTTTARTSSTTERVAYPTAPLTTTRAPSTDGTTSSSRLLIPTTSNLTYRPTVAPMQMTTDSLFSHYKQPEKPLMGPMYLIIEGHSKVKKYGKNEINLHLPKIVPVIAKREPVIRVAEPKKQRGTPETFQVAHLHKKSTTAITTTTAMTPTQAATLKLVSSTTAAPKDSIKITTTKSTPSTENSTLRMEVPPQLPTVPNTPPTGMQGLLSLLGASLGSIFPDEPSAASATNDNEMNQNLITTPSTLLKPMPMVTPLKAIASDAQFGRQPQSNFTSDTAVISEASNISGITLTTGLAPREVRQVFDYDQLPESRLRDFAIESFDDSGDSLLYDDDTVTAIMASDEHEDGNHQLIKRLDRLVDDDDDYVDVDTDADVEANYDDDLEDL